jgi:putative tricarboxylic transport membrane protein
MALLMNQLNIDPAQAVYLAQNSGFDVVNKAMTDKTYVALSTSGDFVAQANAGKVRVLGVASPEKLTWIKAKTLQQQNLNIVYGNWYGIMSASTIFNGRHRQLHPYFGYLPKLKTVAENLVR